jgi:uroporphyrinogen III methyltransferase/synthase
MTVYLVGAGPGDPGLLTVRALELITQADVIIHDRLIPDRVLAAARPESEIIDVGKRGGGRSTDQTEINRLLVEHGSRGSPPGSEGRIVVRLKGGDPFLFGRGGEEAEVLSQAGIPFEVVPGVTAGIAAPAYAGIPVTHRELASAVAFVTGHEDPAKDQSALDWDALAVFPGTLVIYMAVARLGAVAERLIDAGRDPQEPVAVIERGTFADQRVLEGTLGLLGQLGARAPAVALIGPVARLRQAMAWFDRRPLSGISVAVTRAREQVSSLSGRLRSLGAAVVEAPAIRIVPRPFTLPDLGDYDLLCLTSPNGVRLLFDQLAQDGGDARALAGLTVAAIGPGTARALNERGVVADIVPERFVAEALVEALAQTPVRHALVARAAQARDVLPGALAERGAQVDVLELYETRAEVLSEEQLEAVRQADYVTFTSSSTVRFLLEKLGGGEALARARLVSIGPVTSQTLREHGLQADVQAERHDIPGLIDALLRDALAQAGLTGEVPSTAPVEPSA